MIQDKPLTAIALVEYVLTRVGRPLTPDEIWAYACENHVPNSLSGKTPAATIGARIYTDIRDNPDSHFCQYAKRPPTFYLRKMESKATLDVFESSPSKKEVASEPEKHTYNERDLHPLLVSFVSNDPHFRCHCRTIFHEKSEKKTRNSAKWLHPDIVGVYFPFDDYDQSTVDLFRTVDHSLFKLFSFEMKKHVSMGNVREYYFQAISNSSWANEGYLVAMQIDDSAKEELRGLNEAFGIGVIQLDANDAAQSDIIFPSRVRDTLDGNMIDRLVSENPDFKEFVTEIVETSTIKRFKGGGFDPVLEEDQLREHCRSKGIA